MLTETAQAPCRSRPEARGDRTHHSHTCGDAIEADHKVLNEENESRLQRRCAVREQDLYSYWIQSYPTENKTAQETMKSLQKFVPPDHKPSIIQTDNSLFFVLRKSSVGITTSQPHTEQAEIAVCREKGRYLCSFCSVCQVFQKSGEMTNAKLLIFTKHTRQTGRQKVAVPFGCEICVYPISLKDKSRLHHLVQRCFQKYSSDKL